MCSAFDDMNSCLSEEPCECAWCGNTSSCITIDGGLCASDLIYKNDVCRFGSGVMVFLGFVFISAALLLIGSALKYLYHSVRTYTGGPTTEETTPLIIVEHDPSDEADGFESESLSGEEERTPSTHTEPRGQ